VLALVLLLVSVQTPPGLTQQPTAPPAFNGAAAAGAARSLDTAYPSRAPGSAGDRAGARIVQTLLSAAAGGHEARLDRFAAPGADGAVVQMTNVVLTLPGTSRDAIVFLAHHDNAAPAALLSDGASGVGALVQLLREEYGTDHAKTWIFASVDGASAQQAGARRLAADLARRRGGYRAIAVIALDDVGERSGSLPLLLEGERRSRSDASLARSVRDAFAGTPGATSLESRSVGRQILDLIQPTGSRGMQAPFVERRIPALALGSVSGAIARPDATRLTRDGAALSTLLGGLDQSPVVRGARAGYVYLDGRIVPSWASLLVVVALVVEPLLAVAFGLYAVRRAVGTRARLLLVARLAAPLAGLLAGCWLAGALDLVPEELWEQPPWPGASGVGPRAAAALGVGLLVGLAAGIRIPRASLELDEALPGATTTAVCSTVLAAATLVCLAGNPFSAILLAPALHAWPLLHRRASGALTRLAIVWGPLVAPVVVVAALVHLGPLDVVRFLASDQIAAATAAAFVVALAAATALTPTAAGVRR
jgi:hypothetical protein